MSQTTSPGCPLIEGIQLRVVDLEKGVLLLGGQKLLDVRVVADRLQSGSDKERDLAGATLAGVAETGDAVEVRIDNTVAADDAGGRVTRYKVSYKWPSQAAKDSPFLPLCQGGEPAIAIAGEWDLTVSPGGGGKRSAQTSLVTFACPGSAIAKCVTPFGYKPWESTPAGASLDALHQSCVRAVRADYCGNGQSNTWPGEKINIYDQAGIQHDAASWPLEAVWSPDGALCVETTRLAVVPLDPRTRRPQTSVRDYITSTCPQVLHACAEKAESTAAGNGALLFTESSPASPGKAP